MQLGRPRSIRTAVTAITATLLGPAASSAADGNTFDSSLLIYSETNRVTAAEGVFDFGRKFSEQRSLGVRLTLDALTGATPNGATPASTPQSFTGTSGSASYTVPAGEIPLDDTFTDQRLALDATLVESLSRITFLNVGGHLSWEHDYTSVGLNGGISRDFNKRNTTVGLAVAYSHDSIKPIGGAPDPLSAMPPPTAGEGEGEGEGEEGEGGEDVPGKGKDVFDAVFSVTQILGRNTLVRANYSLNHSSGYLNDPYKLLSVVSGTTGEPVTYLYESRSDVHRKEAVFGQLRRYVSGSTVDLSYRYFWDDWGIKSKTADVFVRLPLAGRNSIEPHFRWYHQSAADFHYYYLVDGQSLPMHASADSRLAEFTGYTYGLQYTLSLQEATELRFTGEYYTQKGTRGPPNPVGILAQYDLFPALDVFMFRVGFSHGF